MSPLDGIAIGVSALLIVIALWAARRGSVWMGRIARTVAHMVSLGATAGLFESFEKAKKARRRR
jgi:hypothetical protein